MSKKAFNVSRIKAPEIRNDGELVRVELISGNNQELSLVVKTDQLTSLIEALIKIHGAAVVRQAIPDRVGPTMEFHPMPTPFHVADVNVVSFSETGGISVEVKNITGDTAHLHFLPGHFQFFADVVEKTRGLPPSKDVH